MNKSLLQEFIKKYSLNGVIDKCCWISKSKEKTLGVVSLNDSKNLLVVVNMLNWEGFGDAELGIGDTKRVKTLLGGIIKDDITLTLNYSEDKANIINMDIIDDKSMVTVTTCHTTAVPKSSGLKKVPEFNAEIIFDEEFKERFLKAKGALSEIDSFTILMNKKDKLEMIIGYSNNNTDRFTLELKTNDGKDTVSAPITFNANYLKEILNANPETETSTLYVSDDGLASISFKTDNFDCNYYLMPLESE